MTPDLPFLFPVQVSFSFLNNLLRVIKNLLSITQGGGPTLLELLSKASVCVHCDSRLLHAPFMCEDVDAFHCSCFSLCFILKFRLVNSEAHELYGKWSSISLYNFSICWQVFQESICHCLEKYCLNYSAALLYLHNLMPREDFGSYVKVQETAEFRQQLICLC